MNKSKGMKHDIEDRYSTRDECYAELANAIVLQAVTDWKDGWKRLKKNPKDTQASNLMCTSESFFKSGWYKTLFDYPAEQLLEKLPGMAKAELLETTKRKWINAYKKVAELETKKSTKANQKKMKGAVTRMTEAEEDMRSSWFINLYHSIPEEMIEDCTLIAEEEIKKEEENRRRTKEEMQKERVQKLKATWSRSYIR